MNRELITLYNETMRRHTMVPGMVREETPHTVRYTTLTGSYRYVLWFHFDAVDMDARIAQEEAYARLHAKALCWRVHASDQPEGIGAALEQRGYQAESHSVQHFASVAALCATVAPPTRTDRITVRALTTPEALIAQNTVWRDVWPEDDHARYLADDQQKMRDGDTATRYWAAFDGDEPIGAGSLSHPPACPFALLIGGAVRAPWRGRGVYRALLAARFDAAHKMGVTHLAVDASAESAPVVAKLGFAPQERVVFYEKKFTT
jgi:GNAT superfamily N-acetyltransferase